MYKNDEYDVGNHEEKHLAHKLIMIEVMLMSHDD